MNELWIVFVTDVSRKIRSRIFLIATVLGALFIAAIIEAPAVFSHVVLGHGRPVILAGAPELRGQVERRLRPFFHVVASVDRLPDPVSLQYLDQHAKAAAALDVSVRHHALHVDVYARQLADFQDATFRSLVPLNYQIATGISEGRASELGKIDHTVHGLDTKFKDTSGASFAQGFAFVLIFVLYFSIIIASQSVMASVAEEKTSRIAEILVATISPTNLLIGKTLGAAALAVVQISVWLGTVIVLLPTAVRTFSTAHIPGPDVSSAASAQGSWSFLISTGPGDLLAFAVFFVLGYLQYATIYAAAASLISRTEDLGSVATPVILPVVCAFFIAQYALTEPNGAVSVAFSFVPFVSPFVIFARIAVASVPWWQIALAVAVDALTVFACFWIAGKIYRVGMLLYGRLPSLPQIWSALRT